MIMKYCYKFSLVVSAILVLSSSAIGQLSPRSMTPGHATASEAARELANIHTIENSLAEGAWLSTPDTTHLRSIILDGRWSIQVRYPALALVCRSVNLRDGDSVVETLVSLLAQLSTPKECSEGKFTPANDLFAGLISKDARYLQHRLNHPEALLHLYEQLVDANPVQAWNFSRYRAYDLIVKNPASLEKRQSCLVHIAARLGNTSAPPILSTLVDDGVVQKLRKFSLRDSDQRIVWNEFTLDLLSDYGDLETAKMIRETAIATGEDPDFHEHPGGYLWIIRARHNHDILLDWLRSHEVYPHYRASRSLVLGTAVRWGVDRGSIADAVLEHAKGMSRLDPMAWGAFTKLSHSCVHHGILKRSELPEVPEEGKKYTWLAEMMYKQGENARNIAQP